ncbi:MAG: hypothetical protein AAGF81_04805 [Pseudomonadota bacterium]
MIKTMFGVLFAMTCPDKVMPGDEALRTLAVYGTQDMILFAASKTLFGK